jgi:hypothetical protein
MKQRIDRHKTEAAWTIYDARGEVAKVTTMKPGR